MLGNALLPLPLNLGKKKTHGGSLLHEAGEGEGNSEREIVRALERKRGRERGEESFSSINFLFNVSAPVPLWEREDASPEHKYAVTASWRLRSAGSGVCSRESPSLDEFSQSQRKRRLKVKRSASDEAS